MNAILDSLLWAVFWKSGVALGAALGINLLLRKRSADLRRLVLSVAVVALFVAAAASPILPRWTAAMPVWLMLQQHSPKSTSASNKPSPRTPGEQPELAAADLPPAPIPATFRRIDFTPYFTPWLIPLLWSLGATALLIRFVVRLRGLRRLREASTPVTGAGVIAEAARYGCRGRLWQNETIAAPITWGVVRPVVLVPAGFEQLPPESRDAVLCHEAAHIQARDFLMRGLVEILSSLIWFQPLMWVVRKRLREEQEFACDDRVLASGGKPSAYARLLMDWDARPGMDFLIAVGITDRSCLKRRLYALLDPGVSRDPVAGRGAAGAWLFGMAAAIPLSAVTVTQGPLVLPKPAPIVQSMPAAPKRVETVQLAQTQATPDRAGSGQSAEHQSEEHPQPAPQGLATPAPRFDAVSIKPCQAGDGPGRSGRGDMGENGGVNPNLPDGVGGYFAVSPGRLDITCGSILTMVNFAYIGSGTPLLNNPGGPARQVQTIVGVPQWAMTARYTIHAQTSDPVANGPTRAERGKGRLPAADLLYGPMLRRLLEERFLLKSHRETEQAPMYALTLAPGGLKLFPMKEGDCKVLEPGGGGMKPLGPDNKPYCRWVGWDVHGPNRIFMAGAITMAALVLLCYKLLIPIGVMAPTGYRGGDGCRPSEDPEGRRHLSVAPDGCGGQASCSQRL